MLLVPGLLSCRSPGRSTDSPASKNGRISKLEFNLRKTTEHDISGDHPYTHQAKVKLMSLHAIGTVMSLESIA